MNWRNNNSKVILFLIVSVVAIVIWGLFEFLNSQSSGSSLVEEQSGAQDELIATEYNPLFPDEDGILQTVTEINAFDNSIETQTTKTDSLLVSYKSASCEDKAGNVKCQQIKKALETGYLAIISSYKKQLPVLKKSIKKERQIMQDFIIGYIKKNNTPENLDFLLREIQVEKYSKKSSNLSRVLESHTKFLNTVIPFENVPEENKNTNSTKKGRMSKMLDKYRAEMLAKYNTDASFRKSSLAIATDIYLDLSNGLTTIDQLESSLQTMKFKDQEDAIVDHILSKN